MNDITKAMIEVCKSLPGLKPLEITTINDITTCNFLAVSPFGSLNYVLMEERKTSQNPWLFPYQVNVNFKIPSYINDQINWLEVWNVITKKIDFPSLDQIREKLEEARKESSKPIPNKPKKCTCPTAQLSIRGCTCGGI